ncbi:Hypothetical predicted protein [Olea europaea subsp. europaea]|uniref:Uncharacterized protein n=1 Tax=Olea europaea subsp. europaea TaxID=158383 RepID=A0A8S0RRK4_OLEEU|nr:Hypothetical predicted protein [Olea europaea subsp. europaea]
MGVRGASGGWGTFCSLHVYAILRPTNAEAQQPYFSTFVSYDDPFIPVLDDIARTVVVPQFNASGDSSRKGGHAVREDSDEEASEGRSRRPEVIRKKVRRAAIPTVGTVRILSSPRVIDLALVRTPVEEIGVLFLTLAAKRSFSRATEHDSGKSHWNICTRPYQRGRG